MMKVKLLSLALLLSGFFLQAQEIENKEKKEVVQFSEVLQPPLAPNCDSDLSIEESKKCTQVYIQRHIMQKFDSNLVKSVVKGRVKINIDFIIDKNGKTTNIVATGGPKILNESAMKAVSLLPDMKPATKEGKPINVSFSVPLQVAVAK